MRRPPGSGRLPLVRELQPWYGVKLYAAALATFLALPAARAEQPAPAAPAPEVAPAAPNATLEAVFTRTGQALLFDGDRDLYVLVRVGDAIGALRVTAVSPRQVVLSTRDNPRHHFVMPLAPSAAQSAATPAPSRPVAIPLKPTAEEPLDPYAEPDPAPAPAAPAAAQPPVEPVSAPPAAIVEERVSLRRAELDAALADFGGLAKEIQLAREGNQVRIKDVARGSLFHRLGLRAGDRVVSVADHGIADVEAAAEVYALVQSTDRFTIKLYRGAQRYKIHVELKR